MGSADLCLLIFFIRQLKKGPRNLPRGLEVWPGFPSSEETACSWVWSWKHSVTMETTWQRVMCGSPGVPWARATPVTHACRHVCAHGCPPACRSQWAPGHLHTGCTQTMSSRVCTRGPSNGTHTHSEQLPWRVQGWALCCHQGAGLGWPETPTGWGKRRWDSPPHPHSREGLRVGRGVQRPQLQPQTGWWP